jgi:hypothetical protein
MPFILKRAGLQQTLTVPSQLPQSEPDQSIIEKPELALCRSDTGGPRMETLTDVLYRRAAILLLNQPIDRCKQLHS